MIQTICLYNTSYLISQIMWSDTQFVNHIEIHT